MATSSLTGTDLILKSLRSLLLDHLAATGTLTADAPITTNVIKIPNTSRFRVDDDAYLISGPTNITENVNIADIPDDKTLVLAGPLQRTWTMAETAYIQKAVNGEFIKGIYIGDLKVIPSFPTITIDILQEQNEWFTLRETTHEYRFAIRVYVLEDNFETTNLRCIVLTEQVREILMDHIRPIIDGTSHPLLADLPKTQSVVNIADTSGLIVGGPVFIQDNEPRPSQQENYVKTILSPTAVELRSPADFDYLVSRGAQLTFVRRLLYDTRPESINYGYVPGKGGTFARAAEIQWFAKEMRLRLGNILT